MVALLRDLNNTSRPWPNGTHFINQVIQYKYITVINMVHLILEKKLNLDTEWCITMIILWLKIFNWGHLWNSVSSLLVTYNLIRFCIEERNKNLLHVNGREKEKKKVSHTNPVFSEQEFRLRFSGFPSPYLHLYFEIWLIRSDHMAITKLKLSRWECILHSKVSIDFRKKVLKCVLHSWSR